MMRVLKPLFTHVLFGFLLLTASSGHAVDAQVEPAFEFQDGDRVVFVGDTLIEREQTSGYWERRIITQFPGRHLIFRNLGWSADSPAGESRASFDFDKPGKGFEKLKEQLLAAQPNVVIAGYGMASSFEGQSGLEKFKKDLDRLLDSIPSGNAKARVKVILLSPLRHEDLGRPLPDPAPHNKQLELYRDAIRETARKRQCRFVSLFDLMSQEKGQPLTDNGVHLSAYGYWREAESWRVLISAAGKLKRSEGTKVSNLETTGNGLQFNALSARLPSGFKTG